MWVVEERYKLEGQLFAATPKMRLFGVWESSAEMTVLNKAGQLAA